MVVGRTLSEQWSSDSNFGEPDWTALADTVRAIRFDTDRRTVRADEARFSQNSVLADTIFSDASPSSSVSDYEAIVYDLDGTIVRLAVDWDAVEAEIYALYDAAGEVPPEDGYWTLLTEAGDFDRREAVESIIADHERTGAYHAERLAIADRISRMDRPLGVCSLNCEAACRIALSEHGLADSFEVVIGRDSVGSMKPDPEPLLAALDALEVEPSAGLFVGDSASDEQTADRAGVDFEYVDEHLDR